MHCCLVWNTQESTQNYCCTICLPIASPLIQVYSYSSVHHFHMRFINRWPLNDPPGDPSLFTLHPCWFMATNGHELIIMVPYLDPESKILDLHGVLCLINGASDQCLKPDTGTLWSTGKMREGGYAFIPFLPWTSCHGCSFSFFLFWHCSALFRG